MKDNSLLPILAATAATAVVYGLLTMNKDSFVGELREFKELDPMVKPLVKEEIGVSQVYPQGSGISMSSENSKGLPPDLRLDDHGYPEAYGQSSLGNKNFNFTQGMKILSVKNTGTQDNYASIYFNGENPSIPTDKGFNIEDLLQTETVPGKYLSQEDTPQQSYPAVLNYKNQAIIDGDIPYGEVVDGKVNPRLLSRWEYYTNQYNAQEKLSQSGLLYPKV